MAAPGNTVNTVAVAFFLSASLRKRRKARGGRRNGKQASAVLYEVLYPHTQRDKQQISASGVAQQAKRRLHKGTNLKPSESLMTGSPPSPPCQKPPRRLRYGNQAPFSSKSRLQRRHRSLSDVPLVAQRTWHPRLLQPQAADVHPGHTIHREDSNTNRVSSLLKRMKSNCHWFESAASCHPLDPLWTF